MRGLDLRRLDSESVRVKSKRRPAVSQRYNTENENPPSAAAPGLLFHWENHHLKVFHTHTQQTG